MDLSDQELGVNFYDPGVGKANMQVHLPIAVCLIRTPGGGMELGVHQVRPDKPRSISEFVDARGGDLLYHVVMFTQLSYAECQRAVRLRIAALSHSDMVAGAKEIDGDVSAIERAMTEVALDCSWLTDERRRPYLNPLSRDQWKTGEAQCDWRGHGSDDEADEEEDDESNSLDSFIVNDDDAGEDDCDEPGEGVGDGAEETGEGDAEEADTAAEGDVADDVDADDEEANAAAEDDDSDDSDSDDSDEDDSDEDDSDGDDSDEDDSDEDYMYKKKEGSARRVGEGSRKRSVPVVVPECRQTRSCSRR